MDKSSVVYEFCKENKEPLRDLCPEINQYFTTKYGYEMWNSYTLVREEINYNPTIWQNRNKRPNTVCVRSEYEGLYVRYIEEIDALEIAHVEMDGNRGQDMVAKEWRYYGRWYMSTRNRIFLFHNDPKAYYSDGTISSDGKYYSNETLKLIKSWGSRGFVSEWSYDELKKFVPNFVSRDYAGNKTNEAFKYVYQYAEWYRSDFMERKKSDIYNTIMEYELEDIDFHYDGVNPNLLYFQKLDEKYGVFRGFSYEREYEIGTSYVRTNDCGTETSRLFISAKGKPTFMINNGGEWRIKSSVPWHLKDYTTIYNYDDMKDFTPLKYILPCLGDNISIQTFINILRHPILEQLNKAGYPKIAKNLAQYDQIKADLYDYFDVVKETKQPLFKMLGVNKYVLNAAERYDGSLFIVKQIKLYVGDFDTTNVSESVCDTIAKYVHNGINNSLRDLLPDRSYNYWRRDTSPFTEDEKKFITRLIKMEEKHNGTMECYADAVRTYRGLINKPDIDMMYDVHNYDDVVRLHDAIINIQVEENRDRQRAWDAKRLADAEKEKKTFEKLQDERISKFEYENDKYCIRVPRNLSEITQEGHILHHCVGGYVSYHATGRTNILFLRCKENEDKPFFTIEIDNNNRVVQIHGFGNRWLGNEPDVVPFVYTYLNKIGATYNTNLLLNKATGYSACDETLDKSYLREVV